MIDVKSTIFTTINNAFDKMRLLGQNNPLLLKKILYLIVLDDIYDWSDYMNEHQSVQKRLQNLRTKFIQCNPEFTICRFPFDQHYVNVNTPQTTDTWKRVWDSADDIDYDSIIETSSMCFTPDPTCPVSIVYFGQNESIESDQNGKPNIADLNTLTTCEKMNIYINKETGKAFVLDPKTCTWTPLVVVQATRDVSWDSIQDKPDIPEGIIHAVQDGQLNVHLLGSDNSTWTSDIEVTDSDDSINNPDLEGIL